MRGMRFALIAAGLAVTATGCTHAANHSAVVPSPHPNAHRPFDATLVLALRTAVGTARPTVTITAGQTVRVVVPESKLTAADFDLMGSSHAKLTLIGHQSGEKTVAMVSAPVAGGVTVTARTDAHPGRGATPSPTSMRYFQGSIVVANPWQG